MAQANFRESIQYYITVTKIIPNLTTFTKINPIFNKIFILVGCSMNKNYPPSKNE